MVLICFEGELGAGKTASLTYFALRNYQKHRKIYANYHLNFPYTAVTSIEQIEDMREGFFAGDELWLWLDSRSSGSQKNKAISAILLKSRKRGIQIGYTTQNFHQMDRRIRHITDFIATPTLNKHETKCSILVWSHPAMRLVKVYKFKTHEIFPLFDTNEEIKELPKIKKKIKKKM
jgi:hypothetical protein